MATDRKLYRGFSTQYFLDSKGKSFATSEFNTIKYDLLNHIYTIPGERPMQPGFGTRIPLLAFEPLDSSTVQIVEDDLKMVISKDPRVELIDISVLALPNNNAIIALIDLLYLELNTRETLQLEFPTL